MDESLDSSATWRSLQPWLWGGVVAASALVLGVAALLEPDPRGHGTHTQLGLPPCGFWLLTGARCPGCGLTTAFAHGIRGDWALAAEANPFGLLLFALVCAAIPLGLVGIVRGWSLDGLLAHAALRRCAFAVAACGVVLWVARLAAAV